MNGGGGKNANISQIGNSPKAGFVAVNAKPHQDGNSNLSSQAASHNTHNELMSKFHTISDRWQQFGGGLSNGDAKRNSGGSVQTSPQAGSSGHRGMRSSSAYYDAEPSALLNASTPAGYAAGTSMHATSNAGGRSDYIEKEDKEPYKAEMVSRMEGLHKGDRVLPPCDRCRRLHMDCLKNLTACMGCTKKHAKCSWKEVREEELMQSISEADAKSEEDDSDDDNDDEQNDMDALEMVLAAEQEQAAAAALSQSESRPGSRSERDADDQQRSQKLPQISLHQAKGGAQQQSHKQDESRREPSEETKLTPASDETQSQYHHHHHHHHSGELASHGEEGLSATTESAKAIQKSNADEQLQQQLREEQDRRKAHSPSTSGTNYNHNTSNSESRHGRAEDYATATTTTFTAANSTVVETQDSRQASPSSTAEPQNSVQRRIDGSSTRATEPLSNSTTSAISATSVSAVAPAAPAEMMRRVGSSIAVSPL